MAIEEKTLIEDLTVTQAAKKLSIQMKSLPPEDPADKGLILDFLNKFDSKYPLKNIKAIEGVLRNNYVS